MTILDIHQLETLPLDYNGYDYKSSNIDDEILVCMNEVKADVAFYWYGTGSYEGNGELIYLSQGRWHLYSMSHCSCYGPTERFSERSMVSKGYSFDELEKVCTDEYKKSINPLINLLRDKGYGPAKPDIIDIGMGSLL